MPSGTDLECNHMKERKDRKFPTPTDSRRGFASENPEGNEGQIEGRNAITEALRSGKLGVMDYYQMQNVVSDTRMRDSIAGMDEAKPEKK